MGDFYIIGENRKIADIADASATCAVIQGGTTYVYWRSSLVGGDDVNSNIMVSASSNGTTWTVPAVAYTEAGVDVFPAGVVHNGTNFRLAVAAKTSIANNTVVTRIVSSTNGLTYTTPTTVTWTENWAFPTDLEYVGGTYYLAATVRIGTTGALISSVKTSTNLTTWTSLGYASQLTTVQNVWPRITVGTNGIFDLVHREGDFTTHAYTDNILHSRYAYGSWGPVDVAVEGGSGNPDIAPLAVGYAIIYKDQTIQGGHGIWSWVYFEPDRVQKNLNAQKTTSANKKDLRLNSKLLPGDFLLRGTFSQGFEYGMGGSVLATSDGFTSFYATRTTNTSTAGVLYSRHFTDTFDEPPASYVPLDTADRSYGDPNALDNFSFEISFGASWASLSDGLSFYVGPDDFGSHAQVLRRITAQSPYYEGTYLIHAVRENVQESFLVNVLGVSQNHVTENILLLEEIVSQPAFQIRLTMGDHRETWSCQMADYTVERGHINMHNTRAVMRISVPRLPEVTYEVV